MKTLVKYSTRRERPFHASLHLPCSPVQTKLCLELQVVVVHTDLLVSSTTHNDVSFKRRDGGLSWSQYVSKTFVQSDHTLTSYPFTGSGSCRPNHTLSRLQTKQEIQCIKCSLTVFKRIVFFLILSCLPHVEK